MTLNQELISTITASVMAEMDVTELDNTVPAHRLHDNVDTRKRNSPSRSPINPHLQVRSCVKYSSLPLINFAGNRPLEHNNLSWRPKLSDVASMIEQLVTFFVLERPTVKMLNNSRELWRKRQIRCLVKTSESYNPKLMWPLCRRRYTNGMEGETNKQKWNVYTTKIYNRVSQVYIICLF